MTTDTRRQRRQAELANRRDDRRSRRTKREPARWRSPMALVTFGALAIGVVIVAFALLQQPARPLPPTNDLTSPAGPVPAGLADGRTLGRADAPVTIEIWSDFQCPACRVLAVGTEPAIIDEYVEPGIAKLVYRDAAFQGQYGSPNYDESVQSAAGARCAADQGLFWQMHDWLFANWSGENEGAFRAERLRAIASAARLDLGAYDACMATGQQQAAVRAETQQGLAAGVNSTPTLLVNGTRYTGAPSAAQLSAWIEAARP